LLAHDPGDAAASDPLTGRTQDMEQPWSAVSATALLKGCGNLQAELVIFLTAWPGGFVPVSVVTTAAEAEGLAKLAQSEGGILKHEVDQLMVLSDS
jgi:hypothetical protein